MKNRIPHLLLTILFVGLIVSVVVLNRRNRPAESSGVSTTANAAAVRQAPQPLSPAMREAALSRFGFYLEEVGARSGIDFVHGTPNLDSRLAPILSQVTSMGAAVSVVDFDRDGWSDLYVVDSAENSKNRLYRNNHDGTFTDAAEALGIADLNRPGTGCCMGSVWGDYDNDGFEDLLVYKWGRPELFHNDRGVGFTRVAGKASGLPEWTNANNAIWLDYDGDGKLDLLISGYFPDGVDLWQLKNTRIMPESFEYAQNGGRKWLLRGKGDGTFEDVTAQVGLNSRRWTLAAAAVHLTGGTRPDIFLANDYGVSELYYWNEAAGRYNEIGKASGVGYAPKSGMSATPGDPLNQGRTAMYVANITEEGVLIQGNNLWVPREGTSGEATRFDNLASDLGVERGGWSFGARFADLNNDGWPDLYVGNGNISADPKRSYWYDYSKIAGGNAAIIGDAANWPPIDGRSLSGYQQKCVWINDGAAHFTEAAQTVGANDTYDARAVATADLWNRGVLDVIVANQKGPLLIYRNTVAPGNDWVTFVLEGRRSNRGAIGARVRLTWKDATGTERTQVQEVTGGSGFCAENDRRLHFGLGKGAVIQKALVQWPSGLTQEASVPRTREFVTLKEPLSQAERTAMRNESGRDTDRQTITRKLVQ